MISNKQNINQHNIFSTFIKSFYSSQHKDIRSIIQQIDKFEDHLRDKQEECQSYLGQIQSKKRQNQKYGNLSKGVLQSKLEQAKSKIKNIDSVTSGIKQVVSKINYQKLSNLPVKDDRALKNLFSTLYTILYSENKDFQWNNFKKLVLIHEGGEDFISRLVNYNFKQMAEQKYEKLMELKGDPQFQKVSTKSKFSGDIIQLADWIDYVCLGHQFVLQKAKIQKQYDKIRRDVDKKTKGSLQVSQNFWKQASTQIENYTNQLRNLSSQLKTLSFQMKNLAGQDSPAFHESNGPLQVINKNKQNY